MILKIKKNIILFIFIVFISINFLNSVFALTASSGNYSVNMFGTGMATASPSSSNYNSTVLSEAKGTTRNAESSSLTGNIGFFENTIYYKTVSITSYSISPASAVVGSTIGVYISALNYQSVWAKITSPNSQEQTLTLTNGQTVNYVPSPSVVGTYQVILYANSSTGAITSVVSSFELTAQSTTPPSGGGGTTTIIEKCTYNWDCTPWSVCSDGKQTRECKNIGTCEGNESKPIKEMKCSESLFDIALELKNIELTKNSTLKFSIDLIEKIGTGKIDVHIKYSIMNKEGYEIFSQIETKATQSNLSYQKEIEEIKLIDGEYILRVDILYGNLQRAFAEQKIKIMNGKIKTSESVSNIQKIIEFLKANYLIIILIIIALIFILYIKRSISKEVKFKIVPSEKKPRPFENIKIIEGEKYLEIKPREIEPIKIEREIPIESKKDMNLKTLVFRTLGDEHKKYPQNSILGLMNKNVYSESGHYLGKVNDIILGENRIDSLKIKLDKKHKFKAGGIVIDYKQVKSVNEIVIIDDRVSEYLEKIA
ncbi:MAG: hypothetical protein QT10_C0004G0003 [archaeon GW2011_AR19]|nr:MAG: hypothetical protein QT10_C0004G0003 [archaeon GW2011_AR19]